MADPSGLDPSDVRPYAVTGGRTRPSGGRVFALEAVVVALAAPDPRLPPEHRRLLDLATQGWVSVAELGAHSAQPVGVVRVLLGDLVDAGLVQVHAPASDALGLRPRPGDQPGSAPGTGPSTPLTVLESVLDGMSSL